MAVLSVCLSAISSVSSFDKCLANVRNDIRLNDYTVGRSLSIMSAHQHIVLDVNNDMQPLYHFVWHKLLPFNKLNNYFVFCNHLKKWR